MKTIEKYMVVRLYWKLWNFEVVFKKLWYITLNYEHSDTTVI